MVLTHEQIDHWNPVEIDLISYGNRMYNKGGLTNQCGNVDFVIAWG